MLIKVATLTMMSGADASAGRLKLLSLGSPQEVFRPEEFAGRAWALKSYSRLEISLNWPSGAGAQEVPNHHQGSQTCGYLATHHPQLPTNHPVVAGLGTTRVIAPPSLSGSGSLPCAFFCLKDPARPIILSSTLSFWMFHNFTGCWGWETWEEMRADALELASLENSSGLEEGKLSSQILFF